MLQKALTASPRPNQAWQHLKPPRSKLLRRQQCIQRPAPTTRRQTKQEAIRYLATRGVSLQRSPPTCARAVFSRLLSPDPFDELSSGSANCVVFNAYSLCIKLAELRSLLHCSDYHVVMITETWLNERIPNMQSLDPYCQYFIVRRDHPRDTTGGGVCAFLRRPNRVAIASPVSPLLELCGFDVYWNRSPIRFIVTYRPMATSKLQAS
jgi:hypothetical protein